MRVSTTQVYQQGLKAFGTQQTKLAHLQQQISTGVRLTKPSDDPAAAARVLELEQTVSLNEQYQVNIRQAEQRLQREEATLNSTDNVMQRIRELVIQGNNATMNREARSAIADEIDEKFQELLSLGNSTDANGDYMFAGFQNKTKPFTIQTTGAIDQVVFNGDEGQRAMQISQSRQIDVDVPGRDIFMRLATDSGLNEAIPTTAPLNGGDGVMAPAHVFDQLAFATVGQVLNPQGEYLITFSDPDPLFAPQTYTVTDPFGNDFIDNSTVPPTPIPTITGNYTPGEFLDFHGIRTSVTGTPATGDSFTISTGQYQDVFSVVQNISETLRTGASGDVRAANLAQALDDIDASLDNILKNRTSLGGRLNALEAQKDDNDAYILSTKETLSVLRDTDLAEAISQLTLEQTILDAAQAVFARVTSSSLFNFLR